MDSCLNQNVSTDRYEIIVVDDGSPDECPGILDEYSKQYENVKVIHQENQGLSVARNNGLSVASGEYIWFVDSDDWIEANCLGEILDNLSDNIDLLQIGFRLVWEDRIEYSNYFKWSGIIDGCEAYLKNGIAVAAQFSIVRRDFLINNNLRFLPGIFHEDCEFKPKVSILAQKCQSLNKYVYNYRQRSCGNIMSNFKIKNALDLISGCKSLASYVRSEKCNSLQIQVIGDAIGKYINTILSNLNRLGSKEKKEIIKTLEKNRDLFKLMLKSRKLRYKCEAMLFLFDINIPISFHHKLLRK